jgi:hypothetical protein
MNRYVIEPNDSVSSITHITTLAGPRVLLQLLVIVLLTVYAAQSEECVHLP